MKIAFLVTFSPMTRVVVDVEDSSLEQGDDYLKVVRAARNQMLEDIMDYLNGETVDSIEEDTEIPYPEGYNDKN